MIRRFAEAITNVTKRQVRFVENIGKVRISESPILTILAFPWSQSSNVLPLRAGPMCFIGSKTQWVVHGNLSILSPWLCLEHFLSWTSSLVCSAGEYWVLAVWDAKKLRLLSLDRRLMLVQLSHITIFSRSFFKVEARSLKGPLPTKKELEKYLVI